MPVTAMSSFAWKKSRGCSANTGAGVGVCERVRSSLHGTIPSTKTRSVSARWAASSTPSFPLSALSLPRPHLEVYADDVLDDLRGDGN